MSWADFKTLVSFIGVPGAMMGVLIWAIVKGYLVRKGEVDGIKQGYEARLKLVDKLLTEEKQDKTYWRDAALRGTDLASEAVKTAHTAAEKLTG
jgi:hypothetical protein